MAVFTTQLYDELRSLRIDVSTTVIKSNAKELLSTFQATYGFFHMDRAGRIKLLPAWVPCHNYQLGRCLRGSSCSYLHRWVENYGNKDKFGRIVCHHHQYRTGGCPFPGCKHSHNPPVPLDRTVRIQGSFGCYDCD